MNNVLHMCPLFADMNDDELKTALTFYSAVFKNYARDDMVIQPGEHLVHFGLVISGTVQVMMDDLNGHHMIMATVAPGETFGESLCFRRVTESPVYASAMENTQIAWLSTDGLINTPNASEHLIRFTQMLTRKTLAMNDRIQVLSKLSLREKLMTLFTQYALREGNMFRLPFNRDDMAAYLGVNRSALSRELSKMKREGLIDFYKNTFSIRKHQ